MIKKYIFLLVIIALLSCNKNNEFIENSNCSNVTIHDIKKYNILKYSDLFDSIRLVKLETSDQCLIGNINRIVNYKNKFYILDRQIAKALFVFNDCGKFCGRIGKIGKGPGEYINPDYFHIDPISEEILIYDRFKNEIISYNINGNFKNTQKLKNRIDAFSTINSEYLALYFNYYGNEDIKNLPKHNLHIINRKGKVQFESFNRSDSKIPNIEYSNSFFCNEEDVLFNPSFENRIFAIDSNRISVKYRFDFGSKSISNEFLESIVKSEKSKKDVYEKIENSEKVYIHSFLETNNYLVLTVSIKKVLCNIFYSKITGVLKYANVYLNDMYGIIPGSHNLYRSSSENTILSYFIPSDVPLDYYKQLLKKELEEKDYIREEYLRNIEKNMGFNNMKDFLLNINFNVSEKVVNEISSINQNDNPIIIIQRIKPF